MIPEFTLNYEMIMLQIMSQLRQLRRRKFP